jgi:tRNA pseudouridine38-40 synthase
MTRHVRIDLGYDGRSFFGSQRQAAVRTVQQELEDVLRTLTSDDGVSLVFAGRTDRGVHATGQVASGTVTWSKSLERLRYALDRLTAEDLRIYAVREVSSGFHARFSARKREYRYRIFVSNHAPVLLRGLVWWVKPPLDVDRLQDAADRLVGDQDFRSFAGAGTGSGASDLNTRRELDLAVWTRQAVILDRPGELVEFHVRATSFLPHMVRNLVGALVEVGTGQQNADWISELLQHRDRRLAPRPAPPDGLSLWSVEYDERH